MAQQPSEQADPMLLRFCCVLARQCFVNEYVYDETAEECDGVTRLRDAIAERLAEARPVPAVWLAALACYSPLSSLPDCERLIGLHDGAPFIRLVLATSEGAPPGKPLSRHSQTIDPIDDQTSRLVSSQYEENPYPRWVRSPSAESVSFDDFVANELGVESPRFAHRDRRIDRLIAGCGTGQQSIQTAQRFPTSRILAVDLSAASLAYAMRKTRELRIANIEYAQADILKLDRRQDLRLHRVRRRAAPSRGSGGRLARSSIPAAARRHHAHRSL
jgi:hypothetical protein